MKNSLKVLTGIFLTSLSTLALATPSSGSGKVIELVAGAAGTGQAPQDMVYFKVTNMSINSTCTQGTANPYFVINTASDAAGGKSMSSVILAANMAGKSVWVAGKGTCDTMSGHEDISYVYVKE